MRINNIKPIIYEQKYKPTPDINFKNSGVGILLGWTVGTIGGVVLTSKKAFEEDIVMPPSLSNLIVFISGLSGGFLGHFVEKLIKHK